MMSDAVSRDFQQTEVVATAAVPARENALSKAKANAAYQQAGQLAAQGEYAAARMQFQALLRDFPNDPDLLNNIGQCLINLEQIEEGTDYLRRALAFAPDHRQANRNLYNAINESAEPRELQPLLQQIVKSEPDDLKAWDNLGRLHLKLAENEQALACFQKLVPSQPRDLVLLNNVATCLNRIGRRDEAMAVLRDCRALDPEHRISEYNYALLLLRGGDYRQGLIHYEARHDLPICDKWRRPFKQPHWQGQSFAGKTLLVHAEQGAGDSIQFARYLPAVIARGGNVMLECQRGLGHLMASAGRLTMVIERGLDWPGDKALRPFDLHCPMMSLPRLLDMPEPSMAPVAPYLTTNVERQAYWQRRLGPADGRLRIGLVWAGNPEHTGDAQRSIAVEAFAPLLTVPRTQFYSLQFGRREYDDLIQGPGMPIISFGRDVKDFADTAALLQNLDLLISVDTAPVHLAGALNRPVWTLLPFCPDWRWGLEGRDTPWYASMQLFRQSVPGDWAGVIAAVRRELSLRVVAGGHTGLAMQAQ